MRRLALSNLKPASSPLRSAAQNTAVRWYCGNPLANARGSKHSLFAGRVFQTTSASNRTRPSNACNDSRVSFPQNSLAPRAKSKSSQNRRVVSRGILVPPNNGSSRSSGIKRRMNPFQLIAPTGLRTTRRKWALNWSTRKSAGKAAAKSGRKKIGGNGGQTHQRFRALGSE